MTVQKKITFSSFILPLMSPILFFLFCIIISSYFLINYIKENEYISLIILLSLILPSLILQFNYYKIDKRKVLIIDDTSSKVTIINKNKEISFYLEDVDRLRIIHSKNYDDVFRTLSPWHPHYYYFICLKNNDEFLVTRLLVRKLQKVLKVRVVYKRTFFPFISKEIVEKTVI